MTDDARVAHPPRPVAWRPPDFGRGEGQVILDLSRELERAQQRIAGFESRLLQAETAPPTAPPAPPARSDPWRVDEPTEAYLLSLLGRYAAGLTAVLPGGEPDRPLLPELLLNDGLDLETADHPLVLSLITSRDPLSPTALGATARMMPRITALPQGPMIAKLLRRVARHREVRDSIAIALDGTFSSPAMKGLSWFVKQAIQEDPAAGPAGDDQLPERAAAGPVRAALGGRGSAIVQPPHRSRPPDAEAAARQHCRVGQDQDRGQAATDRRYRQAAAGPAH